MGNGGQSRILNRLRKPVENCLLPPISDSKLLRPVKNLSLLLKISF